MSKILIVPHDVSPEDLMAFVETGTVPPRSHLEDVEEWMARGRVADCDCGLLQCECEVLRQHTVDCLYRRSRLSPADIHMDCSCK